MSVTTIRPVNPLEVLPNGATVLDCLRSPGPDGQWYVLAVWVRNERSEYIIWWLDPVTKACDSGSYTRDIVTAWGRLVERAS